MTINPWILLAIPVIAVIVIVLHDAELRFERWCYRKHFED